MFETLNSSSVVVPLLTIVVALMFLLLCALLIQLSSLKKKYKAFTALSKETDIEHVLISNQKAIDAINGREKETAAHIAKIYDNLELTIEKLAITKYDAFDGMGGQLSAVIVLMNKQLNGYLINSIHTRDGNHMYVKAISKGSCEQALSKEEEETIKKAMTN